MPDQAETHPGRREFLAMMAYIGAGASGPGLAAPVIDTPFSRLAPDAGWVEAVVVVADMGRAGEFFTQVAGWQPLARQRTSRSVLDLWGVRNSASADEVLLYNPGDKAGFVRLVRFHNAGPQQQIRASAMPWETGGVFSLMTRSRDLDGAFERAQGLGYGGFREPIEFEFGGVLLRNVVIRGPDGVNLAVYQRQRPTLTGWTTITRLSAPFNAMQMVQSRDRTRDFFRTILGYGLVAEDEFLDPAPGPNNFALPANLVTSIPRRFAIMAIAGSEVGRMEAMQFVGLTGRDLAERSRFPNYGIAALRYPTHDLGAVRQRAQEAGFRVSGEVTTNLAPYGRVRLAHVRSPDGVIVELMQAT